MTGGIHLGNMFRGKCPDLPDGDTTVTPKTVH